MRHTILCCIVFTLFQLTEAFNFAPEYADIFHVPSRQGSDNYFGYTVGIQRRTNANEYWLIVGAPKANSSHPSHVDIVEPGVVYECQINSENICTALVLDTSGVEAFKYKDGVEYHQMMNHAWIGGALDVQDKDDGAIAICGPRWRNEYMDPITNETSDWHLNGICYLKNTAPSQSLSAAEKFIPLIDLKKQDITRESNGKKKFSYNYRYGEAGLAVHLVKNRSEVLIGAPGVLNWRGSAIRYQSKSNEPDIQVAVKSDYEYFGYSLASGKFSNITDKTFYVSAAPRGSSLHGNVYVFDYPKPPANTYVIHIRLNGTQMGEYFGAALCVADVNGDGVDDLLVGAPLHTAGTNKYTMQSSREDKGDEGKVYVYINKNDSSMFNTYYDHILVGSVENGARFGTAVASIGDVNADGYNDIAIGAPYENEGRGSIYIYHGRRSGINTIHAQRIEAEEISSAISGFGISISKGMDLDGNGFNDIAVGAYSSSQAVLLKSSPTIVFNSRIVTNFDRLDIHATNFTASMCLSYIGRTIPRTVYATVTLRVDTFYKRAQIMNENSPYNVTLHASQEYCGNVLVKISVSETKLFTKPIELYMEYGLDKSKYSSTKFCKYCPRVDPNSRKYAKKDVYYSIGCDGVVCRPDLRVNVDLKAKLPVLLVFEKTTLSMSINVENRGDTAYLMRLSVTIPKLTPLVRLPSNCQETRPTNQKIETPTYELVCIFHEYFWKGYVTPNVLLEVDMSLVPPGTDQLLFRFDATSDGEERTPDDNVVNLKVPLDTIADVEILGTKNQEREQVNLKLNQTYSHTYEIRNYGPSPLKVITADFQIPMALKTSNGTLNFIVTQLSAHLDAKPLVCTRSDQPLEPFFDVEDDNEESEVATVSRKKRVDETYQGNVTTTSALVSQQFVPERTLFVNCTDTNTTCMSVRCALGPFTSAYNRAIISFRFTADLKKLERKLEDIDLIVISSSGRITVNLASSSVQNSPRLNVSVVSTIFYGQLPRASIDLWILAVAIAVGLLVLIIIIAICVKVGFFKRQKKEDLHKLKDNMEVEEAEKLMR